MYRSVVKIYYRNVQAVVLIVSLEQAPDTQLVQKQLGSLDYWLNQLNESSVCQDEQVAYILIGNKADSNDNGDADVNS